MSYDKSIGMKLENDKLNSVNKFSLPNINLSVKIKKVCGILI